MFAVRLNMSDADALIKKVESMYRHDEEQENIRQHAHPAQGRKSNIFICILAWVN